MKISWSRINRFRTCPKQYYYSYIEELEGQPNESLLLGSLMHRMIDAYYTGVEDLEVIQDEYESLIRQNLVTQSRTLLKSVLASYIQYYDKEIAEEKIVASEQSIVTEWDGEDQIEIIIDKVVERDGLITLRDHKTTTGPLKYTTDNVQYNNQLLLYATVLQDASNISVDAVEIDEIRLGELEEPPRNKNGKPTADIRQLTFTTYESYYNTLASMELEDAPEYQNALAQLEKRGHPLFRRLTVMLNQELLSNVMEDTHITYTRLRENKFERNVGRLCDWCEFKELCRLDYYNPTDEDRHIVMEKTKIRKKQSSEPRDEE
jgi:ATP-dependent helicase/DNAse subunit B